MSKDNNKSRTINKAIRPNEVVKIIKCNSKKTCTFICSTKFHIWMNKFREFISLVNQTKHIGSQLGSDSLTFSTKSSMHLTTFLKLPAIFLLAQESFATHQQSPLIQPFFKDFDDRCFELFKKCNSFKTAVKNHNG